MKNYIIIFIVDKLSIIHFTLSTVINGLNTRFVENSKILINRFFHKKKKKCGYLSQIFFYKQVIHNFNILVWIIFLSTICCQKKCEKNFEPPGFKECLILGLD